MKRINADNILLLIFMSVMPTTLVMIISCVFLFLPGEINEIIQSLIVLPFSFIIIPQIILSHQEKVSLEDLGIRKISKKDVIICSVCCLVLYLYLFYNYDARVIVLLSLQTTIVAVSEEFWARGVLFYIIRKITDNWVVVVLISSLIFVFIVHMNRGAVENLLYRMPGAIIMGLIYDKTGKLSYSILFHFIYNILGSL